MSRGRPLGAFVSKEAGARAFDVAAIALRGWLAPRTNYPTSMYRAHPLLLELLGPAAMRARGVGSLPAGYADTRSFVAVLKARLHARPGAATGEGSAEDGEGGSLAGRGGAAIRGVGQVDRREKLHSRPSVPPFKRRAAAPFSAAAAAAAPRGGFPRDEDHVIAFEDHVTFDDDTIAAIIAAAAAPPDLPSELQPLEESPLLRGCDDADAPDVGALSDAAAAAPADLPPEPPSLDLPSELQALEATVDAPRSQSELPMEPPAAPPVAPPAAPLAELQALEESPRLRPRSPEQLSRGFGAEDATGGARASEGRLETDGEGVLPLHLHSPEAPRGGDEDADAPGGEAAGAGSAEGEAAGDGPAAAVAAPKSGEGPGRDTWGEQGEEGSPSALESGPDALFERPWHAPGGEQPCDEGPSGDSPRAPSADAALAATATAAAAAADPGREGPSQRGQAGREPREDHSRDSPRAPSPSRDSPGPGSPAHALPAPVTAAAKARASARASKAAGQIRGVCPSRGGKFRANIRFAQKFRCAGLASGNL